MLRTFLMHKFKFGRHKKDRYFYYGYNRARFILKISCSS